MRWILLMTIGLVASPVSLGAPTLDLPEVSGPGVPYVHYAGMAPAERSSVVATIPSDKDLIITLATADPGLRLHAGETTIIPNWLTEDGGNNAISKGKANIPVGAGQTLEVYNDRDHEIGYFIQGYLIEPGGPYRSFFGSPISPDVTMMTADSDRPFMIQTIIVRSTCDVMIDDTLTIPYTSYAAAHGTRHRGLTQGRGSVVVPAGSRLHVNGRCDYFVNGKYLRP